ncbi:efflux RND transporter periplasmic adaptor subunit, partial [Armatimonas sp.]|uniref:HlyD family secretion protein n=1 Tax=Armatimonas sp. TaxID=1872638 RepID=UPI00286BB4A9
MRRNLTFAVVLSLVALTGCAPQKAADEKKPDAPATATAGTPVRVAAATQKDVTRTISVTGSIAATETVELGAKVSARVTFIAAREGEPVRKGQLLVQQDTADYDTQVRSSEATIKSAEAAIKNAQASIQSAQAGYQNALVKLDQTRTNFKLTDSQSDAGVKDAEQQLASAKAQLEIAKKPQRTQEVSVAESGVAQAQANYERAMSDKKRYESLVREGAAAQITLDQYVNQERVAKAALDSAKSQLELATIGGRDESVRQSQTAVARAEFGLRLAKSNTQQNSVRQDDIKAAQAGVSQAKAALAQAQAGLSSSQAQLAQARAGLSSAQQQVSNTKIFSPIDGIIAKRSTEVGQLAGPTGSLLTIIALDTVFFEAQVPETEIAQVKLGMLVDVKVDALPGRTFAGQVAKLYPTGSTSSRNFVVRIEV